MPLNRLVNANQAPRCAHIKTSGLRCGSPARHGRTYCCFHDSAARRNRDFVLPIIAQSAPGYDVRAAGDEFLREFFRRQSQLAECNSDHPVTRSPDHPVPEFPLSRVE